MERKADHIDNGEGEEDEGNEKKMPKTFMFCLLYLSTDEAVR